MTGSEWSWERVDITTWENRDEEQISTKEAWWRVDGSKCKWLFKPVREDQSGRSGWDWVEFVSMIVADVLGVPCARTRLAVADGVEGSISRDLLHQEDDSVPKEDLVHGRVWIGRRLGVDTGTSAGVRSDDASHTIENIRASLEGVEAPSSELREAGMDAFDAFAGYTCLDALIANQDRHGQNWAVVLPGRAGIAPRLAPSYDHGNGLGARLSDSRRRRYAGDDALLEQWAQRGEAKCFAGPPRTLVQLATECLSSASSSAASYWYERVAGLDVSRIESSIRDARSPVMSEAARSMVVRLLEVNGRRLCDEFARSRL